jgi:hypothetical protein
VSRNFALLEISGRGAPSFTTTLAPTVPKVVRVRAHLAVIGKTVEDERWQHQYVGAAWSRKWLQPTELSFGGASNTSRSSIV